MNDIIDIDLPQRFGQVVRLLRMSSHLTLYEVGKRMGVSKQLIYRIEQATSGCGPTLRTVYRLARALDCRPEDLLP